MCLLEVVDVAPVGRRPLLGRLLLKQLPHHRLLAEARRPQHEQVEPFLPNADPKLDRFQGALLP